jgi:hypothetical protein
MLIANLSTWEGTKRQRGRENLSAMLFSVHSWMWLSKMYRGRLHTLHHVSPYHPNWHSPRPLHHNTVRCFTIKHKTEQWQFWRRCFHTWVCKVTR